MLILTPEEIERKSFEIITQTLDNMGVKVSGAEGNILKRVIHTSADFDYVKNLVFSHNAVDIAVNIIRQGGYNIVTDTNMAKSGVSVMGLKKSGGEIYCYIADKNIGEEAKILGITRAALCMEKAAELKNNLIIAIGNAPTALIKLHELVIQGKINPNLIIATPVGFVNVEESKELIMELNVPYIVARGKKGGSNIAAAIINALLYTAFPRDMDRG